MTISQMLEKIRNGQLSSSSVAAECFARIEENKHLKAVIELNPQAMEIAKKCDEAADKSKPLHGIPILLKDNINTGDNMHTTAGSVALAENIAPKDAPAARLLREAGAVILGKANMTEFACYMSDSQDGVLPEMPNGYSSRGGRCLHPTHPDEDPSGSSTGSAVAVAAGLCPGAVGSETYGSIISPSQHCGIVGIKPTDRLISKEGVIPISFTLDTLGPMANCVEDAGILLSALAGRSYEMKTPPEDISVGILRPGIYKGQWPPEEWLIANEALIPIISRLGMKIVELPKSISDEYDNSDNMQRLVYPIMEHEFQYAMNSYLKAQNNPAIPQNLKEIIEYNEAHAETALKYGQGTLIAASRISDNWRHEPAYIKALAERKAVISALGNLFDDFGIDVMLILSAHCGLAAAAGFPNLTLPIGKTEKGMPIGTCLMAKRFGEDALLAAAKAIELGQFLHQ